MKKILTILTFSSLLIFSGCTEIGLKSKELKANTNISENFIIDSVIEEDSINIFDSVMMKYSSQLLVFPNLKDQKLLQSIYSDQKNITDFSKEGLQKFLINQKKELCHQWKNLKNSSDAKHQQWISTSQMNVKFNKNGYLHIQDYDNIFDGGLRNDYKYTEKVFDTSKDRKLQLQDITLISKDKLLDILKTNIDMTTIMQQIKKYDVNEYQKLSSKEIPMTDNFYFDENNLYFHYNTGEIADGYSIGDIVIPVSWNDLSGTLNLDFKRRMKIKS